MSGYLDGFLIVILAPLVLIVLGSLIVGGVTIAKAIARLRAPFASCGRCRYNLTGSIGRTATCPECGSSLEAVGIRPADDGTATSNLVFGAFLCAAAIAFAAWWCLGVVG